MAGSHCEERIRDKVVDLFRRRWPDGRIIHELTLVQSVGPRLDVACVTPDRIVIAEIKSEKDVLKRMADQLDGALAVTDDVWLFAAEKHRKAVVMMERSYLLDPVTGHTMMVQVEGRPAGTRRDVPNPDYVRALNRCNVMIETEAGFERASPYCGLAHGPRDPVACVDPRDLWELLWAGEAATLLRSHGLQAGARTNRYDMKRAAVENMTGQQIRRGVCAMLRNRTFARADPPIDHGLVQRVAPPPDLYRSPVAVVQDVDPAFGEAMT